MLNAVFIMNGLQLLFNQLYIPGRCNFLRYQVVGILPSRSSFIQSYYEVGSRFQESQSQLVSRRNPRPKKLELRRKSLILAEIKVQQRELLTKLKVRKYQKIFFLVFKYVLQRICLKIFALDSKKWSKQKIKAYNYTY